MLMINPFFFFFGRQLVLTAYSTFIIHSKLFHPRQPQKLHHKYSPSLSRIQKLKLLLELKKSVKIIDTKGSQVWKTSRETKLLKLLFSPVFTFGPVDGHNKNVPF